MTWPNGHEWFESAKWLESTPFQTLIQALNYSRINRHHPTTSTAPLCVRLVNVFLHGLLSGTQAALTTLKPTSAPGSTCRWVVFDDEYFTSLKTREIKNESMVSIALKSIQERDEMTKIKGLNGDDVLVDGAHHRDIAAVGRILSASQSGWPQSFIVNLLRTQHFCQYLNSMEENDLEFK